jgi:hypothetical protein
MRPLPFDASHYGAYFIYWGCRLKISIALNPKKKCNYCDQFWTDEYEFKGGFAKPIIFIFNLHRNVPYFYDTFWVEKSPLLQD